MVTTRLKASPTGPSHHTATPPLLFTHHTQPYHALARAVSSRGLATLSPRLTQTVTPFFRLSLEDFLAGTMLIDIVAMWLPRAWNALTRGALNYHPSKDPKAQEKTGFERWRYITHEKIKRLNIPNFIEECGREAASGPGLFLLPTLIFAIGRRWSPFKRAIQLSQHNIQQLTQWTAKHLTSKATPALDATPASLKRAYTQLLHTLVDQSALLADLPKATPAGDRRDMIQGLNHALSQLADSIIASQGKSTPALTKSQAAFRLQVEQIHRRVMAREDKHSVPLPKGITLDFQTHVNADTWMTTLTHWYDVLRHAQQRTLKQAQRSHASVTPQHLTQQLAQQVASSAQQVLQQKALLVVAAVSSTLAFLYQLVKWTQGHETYVANRTVPLLGHAAEPTTGAFQIQYPALTPPFEPLIRRSRRYQHLFGSAHRGLSSVSTTEGHLA